MRRSLLIAAMETILTSPPSKEPADHRDLPVVEDWEIFYGAPKTPFRRRSTGIVYELVSHFVWITTVLEASLWPGCGIPALARSSAMEARTDIASSAG